CVRLQSNFDYW
nr:immunoglobulin heavy chain junction region [Macaca mulatta]